MQQAILQTITAPELTLRSLALMVWSSPSRMTSTGRLFTLRSAWCLSTSSYPCQRDKYFLDVARDESFYANNHLPIVANYKNTDYCP